MDKQINELRDLSENYSENSPNSRQKKTLINSKALKLYQDHRIFTKLKIHINNLLMFMTQHTQEFKEIQKDFYEIKNLLQNTQTGDIIHMNVAVTTPYGNLIQQLLGNTNRKRPRPTNAQGKTKRRKIGKKKKVKKQKKIDFKKSNKHISKNKKPKHRSKKAKI